MTRRMLINAQNPAELRVAVTSGDTLEDFKVDVGERGLTRGNIYFGIIANIQPSLNAAFIDYGTDKHGFLAIQDVVPDAYYHQPKKGQKPRIETVLEKGQPIVVQVTREPEGSKGAALTTNLSLAGRYLVLMPFEKTRGVSRKVTSEEHREALRKTVASLTVPEGCGVIVRTNALDQTKTTLNRDLNALVRLWKRISAEARQSRKTKLLYSDQDIVLQALRDYLDATIEEVLVDEEEAYQRAEEYMKAFMPRSKTKLIRYQERLPLFAAHRLEPQIERIFERSVPLPSGGSIVIDPTEALTAIDVNSGRSTRAGSQEETAVQTNLEAATEVARQLRLRDIGGLVVVDFIDMRHRRSQTKVEKVLREAMKTDKARCQIDRISSNGLLEVNRQRIQQAIHLRTHRACPTCSGVGRIRSPEIVALHLVRAIEARAAEGFMKGVQVQLHPELADFIQNNRRAELLRLEEELTVKIELVASPRLHRGEQEVSWFARDRAEVQRLEKEASEARKIAAEHAQAASIRQREEPPEEYDEELDEDEELATIDDLDDSDESTEDVEQEAAAETPSKSRRRRRRGGRKRSGAKRRAASKDGAGPGEPADGADGQEKAARSGARAERKKASTAAPTEDRSDGDPEQGSGRPRRRRRRSRRRRANGSANDGGAEQSAAEREAGPSAGNGRTEPAGAGPRDRDAAAPATPRAGGSEPPSPDPQVN
ncbi:MAG TPA: Rne/Rng family ribonuclease [Thermoanaerobaculia bacterium]|nr:Rne/Rng family ribonuclease [Thermoanaerobaculia bacterium]